MCFGVRFEGRATGPLSQPSVYGGVINSRAAIARSKYFEMTIKYGRRIVKRKCSFENRRCLTGRYIP
jgi:hypothetical protein